MKSAGYIQSELIGKDVLGREVSALVALFRLLNKLGVKGAMRGPRVLDMVSLGIGVKGNPRWGFHDPK